MTLLKLSRRIVGLASILLMAITLQPVEGATLQTAAATGPMARPVSGKVAVGYIPVARIAPATLRNLPIRYYTHINLAFANPAADGSFVEGDAMSCMTGPTGGPLTSADLVGAVRTIRSKGPKILISIGGGVIPACSGDWATLCVRRRAIVSSRT